MNLSSRQVKAPKIHMVDTGLLTHLMNIDPAGIVANPTLAGPIFETFVAMELTRQCDWAESYLRDKLGDRFKTGVVLYTGNRTLSFGERLATVPLCGLWA